MSKNGNETGNPIARLWPKMREKLRKGFASALWACYRYNYGVGIQTARLMRRIAAHIRRRSLPLRRRLRILWRRTAVRPARRFRGELRRMRAALPVARAELVAAGKRNVFAVIPCFFSLTGRAVRRHHGVFSTMWRLLAPAAATVVLIVTVAAWSNTSFCLNLIYGGQSLGYIEDANVYDEAASMAKERVNNVDNSFAVEAAPRLAISVQGNNAVLDDTQLCDAILRTAGDSIAEVTGLYVDGCFTAAMESHDELQAVLDGIKAGYYNKDDSSQRAEFIQSVNLVDGLFPSSAVVDAASLNGKLTAQAVVERTYTVQPGDTLSTIAANNSMRTSELRAMNPAFSGTDMVHIGDVLIVQRAEPFLKVKMIQTIYYTEEIAFATQTTYNNTQPVTYNKVKVAGVKGSQDVVAEVTYINGIEDSRQVISTNVTKQPVTKEVEVGTKKVVSSSGTVVVQGDGITTGSMQWPVPVCHNMSRGFQRGHYGLDICNGPVAVRGQPAVAADGGRVIYASTGWNGGYGNLVKVQHSNGIITAYAHLQSIKVVAGQTVSRGQTVGLIGSSGSASGPHLHFEVIVNGVRVNPLNYVRP